MADTNGSASGLLMPVSAYMRATKRVAVFAWKRYAGGRRRVSLGTGSGRVRKGEHGLSSLGRWMRPRHLATPDGLQAGRSGSVRCAARQHDSTVMRPRA